MLTDGPQHRKLFALENCKQVDRQISCDAILVRTTHQTSSVYQCVPPVVGVKLYEFIESISNILAWCVPRIKYMHLLLLKFSCCHLKALVSHPKVKLIYSAKSNWNELVIFFYIFAWCKILLFVLGKCNTIAKLSFIDLLQQFIGLISLLRWIV